MALLSQLPIASDLRVGLLIYFLLLWFTFEAHLINNVFHRFCLYWAIFPHAISSSIFLLSLISDTVIYRLVKIFGSVIFTTISESIFLGYFSTEIRRMYIKTHLYSISFHWNQEHKIIHRTQIKYHRIHSWFLYFQYKISSFVSEASLSLFFIAFTSPALYRVLPTLHGIPGSIGLSSSKNTLWHMPILTLFECLFNF